jgi:hypothetical protein
MTIPYSCGATRIKMRREGEGFKPEQEVDGDYGIQVYTEQLWSGLAREYGVSVNREAE